MKEKIIIRAILPKDRHLFLNAGEELVREVTKTLTGPVANTLVKDEENLIKSWEHAPKIDTTLTVQKTQIKLWVGPKGTNKKYWAFVSLGTTGKVYGTKSAQYLNVRLGYSPKSFVGGGGGTGGYAGPFRKVQQVKWPGIKPRKFEQGIVKRHEKTIVLQVAKAIQRVLVKYA